MVNVSDRSPTIELVLTYVGTVIESSPFTANFSFPTYTQRGATAEAGLAANRIENMVSEPMQARIRFTGEIITLFLGDANRATTPGVPLPLPALKVRSALLDERVHGLGKVL